MSRRSLFFRIRGLCLQWIYQFIGRLDCGGRQVVGREVWVCACVMCSYFFLVVLGIMGYNFLLLEGFSDIFQVLKVIRYEDGEWVVELGRDDFWFQYLLFFYLKGVNLGFVIQNCRIQFGLGIFLNIYCRGLKGWLEICFVEELYLLSQLGFLLGAGVLVFCVFLKLERDERSVARWMCNGRYIRGFVQLTVKGEVSLCDLQEFRVGAEGFWRVQVEVSSVRDGGRREGRGLVVCMFRFEVGVS